jgi:hypothetical protein
MRGVVSVPLLTEGVLTGVLSVGQGGARSWREEEVSLISAVGQMLGETVQRLRELVLRGESERRLRCVIAGSFEHLFRVTADWTEVRIFDGVKPDSGIDLTARSWLEQCLPIEERGAAWDKIGRGMEQRCGLELTYRSDVATGETVQVVSRVVPRLGPDGEVAEWIGLTQRVPCTTTPTMATVVRELEESIAPLRNGLASFQMDMPRASLEKLLLVMDRQLQHLVERIEALSQYPSCLEIVETP